MIKRYLTKRNNPWELLIIAALIFVPGVIMLFQKTSMVAFPQVYRGGPPLMEVISPDVAHVFGIVAILFALLIVICYYYLRRLIARELESGDTRSIREDI